MKESGLGREGGQEGITEYLETKLIGISIWPGRSRLRRRLRLRRAGWALDTEMIETYRMILL
jgi:hypothetical protein